MRLRTTGSIGTTVLGCLLFIAVVVGMFFYSKLRTPTADLETLQTMGVVVLPKPRDLAPFALRTAAGEAFTNADLQGRWNFVFFGFTNCPDICPVSMSVLAQAEQRLRASDAELAKQFRGVLVTVDPERDDPATLQRYVTAFADEFIGLWGEVPVLAEFARQLNATFAPVPDDNGGYTIDHTGNIVIINPKGHYHGFIKMPHSPETVAMAFRSLALNF